MEEPSGQNLNMNKIHRQTRAAYAIYGIAFIMILLIVYGCYHIFSYHDTREKIHGNTEVYILKDEVVDNGYIQ